MNNHRKTKAHQVRVSAADLAFNRDHPRHIANGDEQKFRRIVCDKNMPSYLASFTKGMPHCETTGLVLNPSDFKYFVKGIDSGDPRDFVDTALGPIAGTDESPKWRSYKAKNAKATVRAWESQGAGNTYDLEGPDSHAVTMPPAPALGSDELIAEMGEVYAQALLRDVPFTDIVSGKGKVPCKSEYASKTKSLTVNYVIKELNKLTWFNSDCCSLNVNENNRKRGKLTGQTAFRGITPGLSLIHI